MKKVIIILFLITLVIPVKAQKTDLCTGNDKMAHYTVSITGTLFLTTLYEQIDMKRPYIKAAGTIFCIGLGKELIYDGLFKKGNISAKDMVWNAAGCMTGYVAVVIPFEIMKKKNNSLRSPRTSRANF
jgi:uncharacterized protein YfiM (DUF2279 family)